MKIDDGGIGAAARMGMAVYDQAARGSGRTYRMVMALEEGATVLGADHAHWISQMIRDLRGREFSLTIKVVDCKGWRGVEVALADAARRRSPVAIDHHLIHRLYEETFNDARRRLNDLGIGEPPFTLVTEQPPPIGESFALRGR